MNEDLLQLIKDYTTKEHTEISVNLLGKSKDNLISMLLDLLTTYYNDVNSSTMRELVVAVLAGYQPNSEKLGYNGFRQNTLTGTIEHCEIKPRNVRSYSTAKNPRKLDGSGNFTDYSWQKFERHQKETPICWLQVFLMHTSFTYSSSVSTNKVSHPDCKNNLNTDFPRATLPVNTCEAHNFHLYIIKTQKV